VVRQSHRLVPRSREGDAGLACPVRAASPKGFIRKLGVPERLGVSRSGVILLLSLSLDPPTGPVERRLGQAGADSGGLYPIVLCHNVSQCLDQGQWMGKCRIGRRCGRASLAGTVTILRRSVDPRARVC